MISSLILQFLATFACSTIALAVGMMVAVLTTIVGALHNSDEKLSMNDEQASWFGKLLGKGKKP